MSIFKIINGVPCQKCGEIARKHIEKILYINDGTDYKPTNVNVCKHCNQVMEKQHRVVFSVNDFKSLDKVGIHTI